MTSRHRRFIPFLLSLGLIVLVFWAGYLAGQVDAAWGHEPVSALLRKTGLPFVPSTGRIPPGDSISSPSPQEQERFKVFWEAWTRIDQEFYDRSAIDYQKMVYGAIRGMVESLGDPYTMFLDPVHAEINDAELRGTFEGIGIQVEMREGRLVVVAPLEGTPGERAGLLPGDIITHVDGKDISRASMQEAVMLIRGPKGTPVTLTVEREGGPTPLTFEIVREEIKVQSVRYRMLEDGIAYVRLAQFGGGTTEELSGALQRLQSERPRALVLDLRNNPGGYLQTAVDVASQFMSDGVVLYQQRAGAEKEAIRARAGGQATTIPMAVLVNKGSASASEIVAAALRDNGRAVLVGERTFGKGLVQNVHQLSDRSSLRVTTAQWLTPRQEPINNQGLVPDLVVPAPQPPSGEDVQLREAVRYLKGHLAP